MNDVYLKPSEHLPKFCFKFILKLKTRVFRFTVLLQLYNFLGNFHGYPFQLLVGLFHYNVLGEV